SFNRYSGDGYGPTGGMIFVGGKLYGTTQAGGASCCGTVFQLVAGKSGTWAETVLHSFTGGEDGAYPWAGLIFLNGRLYGTTSDGGSYGGGNVFRLARIKGAW